MFRSFTFRLALAFAGAGVLTATVTAILVNFAFAGELSGYLTQQQDRQRLQVVTAASDAYRRAGGWGTADLAAVEQITAMSGGSMQILDASGRVARSLDANVMPAGMVEMQTQMSGSGPLGPVRRIPVVVDGKTVGTVVMRMPEVGLAPADAQFHRGVNGLFVIGGLTGALIAVIMGIFLARRATAPARELAKAARALADGDRSQRVPYIGQDEFGQMGKAFNAMAEAIDEEDRLRRNFAAAVAHEVRTPLSILQSEVEALQDRVVRPSPRALASLHEEVMRMVRAAVTEFAGPYAAEGLRLESDLATVEAHVDGVRIRQAISNLLSNSLKFTPEGGRVLVEVGPESGMAVIRVTDSGSGIAEAELPRVFDRFFRGSGVRPAGSGIGLTVVQELVRAHGGQVVIRSTEGKGTAVTIQLHALPGRSIPTPKRRMLVGSGGNKGAGV